MFDYFEAKINLNLKPYLKIAQYNNEEGVDKINEKYFSGGER